MTVVLRLVILIMMERPKVPEVTSLADDDDKTATSYVTVEYDAARGSAATGAEVFADAGNIVEVVRLLGT